MWIAWTIISAETPSLRDVLIHLRASLCIFLLFFALLLLLIILLLLAFFLIVHIISFVSLYSFRAHTHFQALHIPFTSAHYRSLTVRLCLYITLIL